MVLAIGLLIAPSIQHRIVEKGEDTARIQRATSVLAGLALMPFQTSLGLSIFMVCDRLYGSGAGISCGKPNSAQKPHCSRLEHGNFHPSRRFQD
jgi:hypothetical protein